MRRINKALCLFAGSSCGGFLLLHTWVNLLFYLRRRAGAGQQKSPRNFRAVLEREL
ncbi:hypothetical protein [Campylobacter magnus]|uniref:Uncharacterized protein n=1 Tax=Campylobacter magnus TaxID=3026462 RepID=A0ABT8T759_9BACT|nr:hypothetical protein [Campylobacter magnus]MDO2409537.1 hypothetical protein [Campylobacter magnus]